jgi:steroid delta-isomerase-like uncharacterized protein
VAQDELKRVYRRFLDEAFNRGDLDALDDILDPAYVDHNAPPGTPPGIEPIKGMIAGFRSAFPDVNMRIEDQIAEGDRVATRYTFTGTHMGNLMGIPPSGKSVSMTGITIARIADGKMVEGWVVYELLSLMQQIGVVPSPQAEPASLSSH